VRMYREMWDTADSDVPAKLPNATPPRLHRSSRK
jgi:hypothetical protein